MLFSAEATALLPGRSSRHRCERCGSESIQWFTPHWPAVRAGIFLCLSCSKINVRCSDTKSGTSTTVEVA